MRYLFITASASVLLSGCSWMDKVGLGASSNVQNATYAQYGGANLGCVVQYISAPPPPGCLPHQVTLAGAGMGYDMGSGHGAGYNNYAGGFAQQPNFGDPVYATAGFGSHADSSVHRSSHSIDAQPNFKTPKFRGSLSLGLEKSYNGYFSRSGDLAGPTAIVTAYDPNTFAEGFTSGVTVDGNLTTVTYSALIEDRDIVDLEYDDIYKAPTNLQAGVEYILSPKSTIFGNVGYSYADGENVEVARVQGELRRTESVQSYDDMGVAVGAPVVNIGFIPNVDITRFKMDFSDYKSHDLELGYRHYLNPILTNETDATVTPFVSAALGATHVNELSVNVQQEQLFFQRAFDDDEYVFYNVVLPDTRTVLAEDQWLPKAALNAGVEWQMSPRSALAFETGIKYQGGRDFVGGGSAEDNYSIPFTVRGSYNF